MKILSELIWLGTYGTFYTALTLAVTVEVSKVLPRYQKLIDLS